MRIGQFRIGQFSFPFPFAGPAENGTLIQSELQRFLPTTGIRTVPRTTMVQPMPTPIPSRVMRTEEYDPIESGYVPWWWFPPSHPHGREEMLVVVANQFETLCKLMKTALTYNQRQRAEVAIGNMESILKARGCEVDRKECRVYCPKGMTPSQAYPTSFEYRFPRPGQRGEIVPKRREIRGLAQASPATGDSVPGEFIVKFRDGIDPERGIADVQARVTDFILRISRILSPGGPVLVTISPVIPYSESTLSSMTFSAINASRMSPLVEYAEPNSLVRPPADETPGLMEPVREDNLVPVVAAAGLGLLAVLLIS